MNKKLNKQDIFKYGLAIAACFVALILVFSAFDGFGIDLGSIGKGTNEGYLALSLLGLMLGVTIGGEFSSQQGTFGPLANKGSRAAFILILIAIIVAGIIIFGTLSKKISNKNLKILAIGNAVILVIAAILILCTKPLIISEIDRAMPGSKEELNKYGALGWGAIAAAVSALLSAVGNIGLVVFANKNHIEDK